MEAQVKQQAAAVDAHLAQQKLAVDSEMARRSSSRAVLPQQKADADITCSVRRHHADIECSVRRLLMEIEIKRAVACYYAAESSCLRDQKLAPAARASLLGAADLNGRLLWCRRPYGRIADAEHFTGAHGFIGPNIYNALESFAAARRQEITNGRLYVSLPVSLSNSGTTSSLPST